MKVNTKSKLNMLKRFRLLWPSIQHMISDKLLDPYLDKDGVPDAAALERLDELIDVLEPFEEATALAGSEQFPTLARVPETVKVLLDQTAPNKKDSESLAGLKAQFH